MSEKLFLFTRLRYSVFFNFFGLVFINVFGFFGFFVGGFEVFKLFRLFKVFFVFVFLRIGTLMLIVAGFGWAKPVMVNPMNMRGNPRTSMAIVAAAGPLSNLILAAIGAMFVRFGLVSFTAASSSALSPAFLLGEFIWINLILAFFNLIPIPPLDGSKILFAILPGELVYRLRPLEQFGFIILMAVVFFAPQVLQAVIVAPALATLRLLTG